MDEPRTAFRLGLATFLPLFAWWLGWFPGFLSSDSVDQLTQVETGEFTNFHPAAHTLAMWVVTRVWDNPGAVTLVQAALMALLFGVVAGRMVEIGVRLWPAVGTMWAVAVLPAVAPMTLAVWKDVPFTLAFIWVAAELLLLGRLGDEYWEDRRRLGRLAAGLALMWLFRHNGFLTVIGLLLVLGWGFRHRWRRLLPVAAVMLAIVVVVQGPLFWIFGVDRTRQASAEILIPDVAASFVHEPGNFSQEDLTDMEEIAPLDVWRDRYDCDNANFLLFDPQFDIDAVRADPGPMMRLGLRTVLRDPDTVLGHRWCAASYLFVPPQPESAFLQRPPFAIAANELGIERRPISDLAFDASKQIFDWADPSSRLWFTWRPALVIWAGLATLIAVAYRRWWGLMWVFAFGAIHLLNVAATSLGHQFRQAYPVYLLALLLLPLWSLITTPGRARLQQAGVGFVRIRRAG